ncbi:MAG: 16S rRNA (cytidine(1402)-2'-O)-methyltransferase [Gemmatimonadaceae bacterium]
MIEAGRGTLYVVSTPIGNMGDFSFRGVEILRNVALVLAEDTRHSRHLLDRYDITTSLAACHEHNETTVTPRAIARMMAGESVALISDAGTPLLSDPGARLVAAAVAAGVDVVAVPGASALLSALVVSSLPADHFTFLGFLERKGPRRASAVAEIAALHHTAVIYEAPGRVAATLAELAEAAGRDRPGAVARELTKRHEEVRRGTLGELAAYYEDEPPRGEVVIVIAGSPPDEAPSDATLRAAAGRLRAEGLSSRDVASRLAEQFGASRNVAYRIAQES